METTITVRPAGPDDIDDLAGVLGRAFEDYPMMSWLVPDADRRARVRHPHFELALRKLWLPMPGHHVSTTPSRAGVAVWVEPDHWRLPKRRAIPVVPGMIRIHGIRTMRRIVGLPQFVEKRHPTEPHWYLQMLGVDPAHQRTGVGSALVKPALDRCDREGLPAYLETLEAENVAYYRRHGFEVRDEADLPRGGLHVWLMWREPR
jgi:ribosomal protein S18 acetylase RimI-like enzyme